MIGNIYLLGIKIQTELLRKNDVYFLNLSWNGFSYIHDKFISFCRQLPSLFPLTTHEFPFYVVSKINRISPNNGYTELKSVFKREACSYCKPIKYQVAKICSNSSSLHDYWQVIYVFMLLYTIVITAHLWSCLDSHCSCCLCSLDYGWLHIR